MKWPSTVRKIRPEPADLSDELLATRRALAAKTAECEYFHNLVGNLALFSQSLESTQASLATMAANLEKERHQAADAVGQTASGRTAVEEMAHSLDLLADTSSSSASRVGELDERAGKIVGVVDSIRDIASNIKLLSLNAAVEAARAGQHGAGFAVVAHEVRSLAEKSGTATQAITTLAAGIRDVSGVACHEIGVLAKGARDHSVRGKDVIQTMQAVMHIAGDLEQVVASSSLRSFVELAKLDHLVFKFKVYRALLGQIDLEASALASHRACRLGKWYYEGEGYRCFSTLAGYRELERPHEAVHAAAARALQHSQQGDDAALIVAAVEDMEHASFAVLESLEQMAVSNARD